MVRNGSSQTLLAVEVAFLFWLPTYLRTEDGSSPITTFAIRYATLVPHNLLKTYSRSRPFTWILFSLRTDASCITLIQSFYLRIWFAENRNRFTALIRLHTYDQVPRWITDKTPNLITSFTSCVVRKQHNNPIWSIAIVELLLTLGNSIPVTSQWFPFLLATCFVLRVSFHSSAEESRIFATKLDQLEFWTKQTKHPGQLISVQ